MILELRQSNAGQRVTPPDTVDYQRFCARHPAMPGTSELRVFERFYGARALISDGLETYIDATIIDPEDGSSIQADLCGISGDRLDIVFCESGHPASSLVKFLEKVQDSENARATIISPPNIELQASKPKSTSSAETPRVSFEFLDWFDEDFDRTLRETLRIIDVIGNETRMKMLVPLFRKAGMKKEYRARINPKLVYQNLAVLLDSGIVDESEEGTYELSDMGKSVLVEFITFLEKTRRTLDAASRQKEVTVSE